MSKTHDVDHWVGGLAWTQCGRYVVGEDIAPHGEATCGACRRRAKQRANYRAKRAAAPPPRREPRTPRLPVARKP